jgi:peptide/nickel transport system ATP-binding protein
MVGLESPSGGTVSFDGRDVSTLDRDGRLELRRAVQLVAQDTSSSFDPRRTLRDAVRLPAQRLRGLSRAAADERVDQTLELLSLPPGLADRRPAEVSGGQRQRFSLARALVVEPRLLVCDEVVSALDVSVQGSILNLLKRYCAQQGAGLVFVSHGLPATAFIADDLVIMHRGRIVEQSRTEAVLAGASHPYSALLLAAHRGRREGAGAATSAEAVERQDWACHFAVSCPHAIAACETERPVLARRPHPGRGERGAWDGSVACHNPLEGRPDGTTLVLAGPDGDHRG